MSLPQLYLSKPGISLPRTATDNAEIVRRVQEQFRGAETEWPRIQSAIEHMFGLCNTRQRYFELDDDARVAAYAADAARHCLEVNGASLDEVDLVVCGGIARQYFEPATAVEVAATLGLEHTHAFDVTTACVGHLEAVQAAAAYLALHGDYRCALVCTAELSGHYLSYDIQSVRDLSTKFAGLTIGNGATCMLLQRVPFPDGGIRLLGMQSHTAPDHWELCQVPIDGTLISSSVELMRLRRLIPPLLEKHLDQIGWSADDVDHFIFHQPSETEIRHLLKRIGAAPDKAVYSHHLYGNTASAAVGLTYHRLLQERSLSPGDKIVLGSAAAGFSVVVITGVWADSSSASGEPGTGRPTDRAGG